MTVIEASARDKTACSNDRDDFAGGRASDSTLLHIRGILQEILEGQELGQ